MSSKTIYRWAKKLKIHPGIKQHRHKYKTNCSFFQSIDTPDKAYFLGLLYADGNVSKLENGFSIGLVEPDKHILEKLRDLISPKRPIGIIKCAGEKHLIFGRLRQRNFNMAILRITCPQLAKDLISHGCVPNKTFVIQFPFSSLKPSLYSHFIRGFFDGDGSISREKKTISLSFIFLLC